MIPETPDNVKTISQESVNADGETNNGRSRVRTRAEYKSANQLPHIPPKSPSPARKRREVAIRKKEASENGNLQTVSTTPSQSGCVRMESAIGYRRTRADLKRTNEDPSVPSQSPSPARKRREAVIRKKEPSGNAASREVNIIPYQPNIPPISSGNTECQDINSSSSQPKISPTSADATSINTGTDPITAPSTCSKKCIVDMIMYHHFPSSTPPPDHPDHVTTRSCSPLDAEKFGKLDPEPIKNAMVMVDMDKAIIETMKSKWAQKFSFIDEAIKARKMLSKSSENSPYDKSGTLLIHELEDWKYRLVTAPGFEDLHNLVTRINKMRKKEMDLRLKTGQWTYIPNDDWEIHCEGIEDTCRCAAMNLIVPQN